MFNLRLENADLGYKDKPVLQGINLEIMPGEMLGIIGPNGTGKSTLIRSISRFIAPLAGKIFIDGRTLDSLPQEELARIMAVVPQNAIIPELFTALEIVLMGRTPHLGLLRYESERDLHITQQVMQITDTLELAYRIVRELSGGEKQRLLLARALAQEPHILLLDEPVANLDINHQVETLNLLRKLCHEQKLIVLIALHDLNLATQFCDRLAILHNHRIEHVGTPQKVVMEDIIRDIFGANIIIFPHPINSLPVTLIVPDNKEHFT